MTSHTVVSFRALRASWLLAVLTSLLALAGCAQKPNVLAKVGAHEITVEDFTEAAKNAASQYPPLPDTAKVMLLRDLVQRQLLVEGANAAGYYRDTVFLDYKQRAEDQILRQEVLKRLAGGPFPVSDAEVEAIYKRRDHDVRARLIFALTEETIRAAKAALDRGTPFAEVADRFNIPGMIQHGGELGFVTPGPLVPQLDDQLVTAPIGKVVGPMEIPGQGWFLIEVEERRPRQQPPLAEERRSIEEMVKQRKERSAALNTINKLRSDYSVKLTPGAAQKFIEKLRPDTRRTGPGGPFVPPVLSTGELATVLATYQGGSLTLGDAQTALDQQMQKPNLSVVPAVERWLESQALERVALLEAKRQRLLDEPAIQRRVREELNGYLMNTYYEKHVLQQVQVTPEDVQAAYQQRMSSYVILQEAKLLIATFKDSASAAALGAHAAHASGLREAITASGSAARVKEVTVRPAQDPAWQPLMSTLTRMEPKEIGGPFPSPQGWMLIQMESKQTGAVPYEQLPPVVQQSLQSTAAEMKREARLKAVTDSLRQVIPVKENFAALKKVPWPTAPGQVPQSKTIGG
jgi:peptidyl-prolyl cis-trans isomerase C